MINRWNATAYQVAKSIVDVFQTSAITPHRTGNLRWNGIKAVELGKDKAAVVFGGEVAPYAVYLEFSPFAGRSRVIPNKHIGFAEKIIEQEAIPYLEVKYGGKRV